MNFSMLGFWNLCIQLLLSAGLMMFSFCILYLVSCYFETKFQECYIISLHLHSFSKVLCREKSLLLNMASNMIWIPFCFKLPAELSQTMLMFITKAVTLLHMSISMNKDTLHHRLFRYFMIGVTFSCVFLSVLGANCRGCKISCCWMMQIKELDCTVPSWGWYSIWFLSDDDDDVM